MKYKTIHKNEIIKTKPFTIEHIKHSGKQLRVSEWAKKSPIHKVLTHPLQKTVKQVNSIHIHMKE